MTKLHHKGGKSPLRAADPESLSSAIRDFLDGCRSATVLEPGEDPIPLGPGSYGLDCGSGHVVLEIWDECRSITRRVVAAEKLRSGVLECAIVRFGGAAGRLTILDADRPQAAYRVLRGSRQTFAEHFRRMLTRQFPAWEIAALTCAPDLQRSFSPIFPRARLQSGNRVIAALACLDSASESTLLSFALIWFDHVHRHSPSGTRVSLALFLPEQCGRLTAHRLRYLRSELLSARLFLFNTDGSAGEVDPSDLGNLETRVASQCQAACPSPELSALISQLCSNPRFGCCQELDGGFSVRYRGIEFAKIESSRIVLGIDERRSLPFSASEEVKKFAAQLEAVSSHDAPGHSAGPVVLPERWLESHLRKNLTSIDPTLLPLPVHGQVLTFAGGDRDLIDLLAISSDGRLAVLEIKCEQDIHLPLQALDYWTRIKWHAERGELAHLFPDIAIQQTAPKLYLVAPATEFHASNELVLRYFSPEIQVERVGVNSAWRNDLRVVMRLAGASVPQSHLEHR